MRPESKQQFSRREFVGNAATGAAVMTFGAVAPKVLCHAAATSSYDQRILIVVEMAGGNDGLNTVVPHADPAYRKARPTIGISKSQLISVTSRIGLHVSMRGFADLFEQDRIAIVQGVGYDRPNRSHFESMDIWHTCRRKGQVRNDGWVGRFLDEARLGGMQDPSALHLGAEKQPFALMSRSIRVPSIQSLEQFRLRSDDGRGFRTAIRDLAAPVREADNDLLSFVQSSTTSAVAASERMESAGVTYKPSKSYPSSRLGKKLETVAKLIASGLHTRVYYVRIDGFDTHANQPDAHAALLREVSDAVSALVQDLDAHGDGDRVLVMCFSEFGRRVAENASDGTDHGTAAPVFLAGNKVNAGLIGRHPSLTDLTQGDLKHHTDFRQVYAAVLEDWMGCDSERVLGGRFAPVNVIA